MTRILVVLRWLSTITKSGSTEVTEYQHPDRLGTKLITNTANNTQKEHAVLPFGTEIPVETTGTSNQRFTSYDRSGVTGLDYAVNRTYNSGQSRFTQVDPIGMASASVVDPQSLNLFAYVTNDPIGFVDPSGTNMSSSFGGQTCYMDGFQVSCGLVSSALSGGWAVPDRNFSNPSWMGYWENKGGWEDDQSMDTSRNLPDGTIIINSSTRWVSNWVFNSFGFSLFDFPHHIIEGTELTVLSTNVDTKLNVNNGKDSCRTVLNNFFAKNNKGTFENQASKFYQGSGGHKLFRTGKPIPYSSVKASGETSSNRKSIILNARNDSALDSHTFIHEIVHAAFKSNDHVSLVKKILEFEGINKKRLKRITDDSASGMLNAWIGSHCTNGNTGELWQGYLNKYVTP